ncbi:LPXTG-motif cell wall-anchored protein [Homoserinimonas aerilata]|uniref:LPXTG-motif cell wall-anchored protein n=1 Tax=Homoserinimonas aerilata TaxID=1162970 RepID=A0A542YF35_9MICO|nr:LPXTG cell wall anchor domain-containing protein [Homoserinimonas aerilata]TQL46708.1 LPXTG-motif cell wall-anchored protein [Homoserinimonas aerilata]
MIATLLIAGALLCPPGTVPGWLDRSGEPTSCVNDVAVWEEPAVVPPLGEFLPVPVEPLTQLPHTGPDPAAPLVGGIALLILGFGLIVARRLTRQDNS